MRARLLAVKLCPKFTLPGLGGESIYPIAMAALLGFSLAGCKSAAPYARVHNLDSGGESIVCFGDSLTEGVGARAGEDYPAVLARSLGRAVVNAGRRGDTAADGLARVERDVLARNPRLVIVLFGGNDFLRRIPLSETGMNLEKIVRRVQSGGAMVALVGARLGVFTDEYGPVYEEVARRHGALLIPDVLGGVLTRPELTSDPIHPNGAGYRLMAGRIFKGVKPLLEEANRRRALLGQARPAYAAYGGA